MICDWRKDSCWQFSIKNNMILSWGANTHGQLGQGKKSEQCLHPCKIPILDIASKVEDILQICGGGGHTLMLDQEGQIFACGSNDKGQLGLPDYSEALHFEKINNFSKYNFISITCGWNSSFAVTDDGTLFVWGSNAYGQLGLPSTIQFVLSPVQLTVPPIKHVASGLRHTAMVTKEGDVLVCGSGRRGCLGVVDNNQLPVSQIYEPIKVQTLHNISSVACGQHHTIAIDNSGHIFAWGDNRYGQLGCDPALFPSFVSPMEILFEEDYVKPHSKILCGWTHTVINTDGAIINWGRNCYGQLGVGNPSTQSFTWKPNILKAIPRITNISLGSEHNIAVTVDGQLLSWGWNEHGSCGTGTEHDVQYPIPVTVNAHYEAKLIGTGAGHSFAIINI